MELLEKFSAICKENGWKNTPQRYRIFCEVHENFTHPSVDSVWEKVRKDQPSISRESVYRILNEFAERGLIMRLDDLNSARYDWRTEPHGHFICSICGKISDFPINPKLKIPDMIDTSTLTHIELRLVGKCQKCLNKEKTNRPGGTNS